MSFKWVGIISFALKLIKKIGKTVDLTKDSRQGIQNPFKKTNKQTNYNLCLNSDW